MDYQNIITSEPIIRVGIMAAPTIQFELKGQFMLNGSSEVAPGLYTLTSEEIYKSVHSYKPLTPNSTFILKNVTIGIGFHWEQQENQEFEGGLTLQYENGLVRAVNEVPLESYLKSVISSEMSAMNDQNLLNAHAIVSRSWLLSQIQNKLKPKIPSFTQTENEITKWYDREDHNDFDVCADDHCQRYQGVTKVISENAQRSIEATRGQVLVYKGEICDARFSKCCGGMSEDFENVWQPVHVPYLVAVQDCLDAISDFFCNTTDPEILGQVLIDFDRATTNFYRWKVAYTQQKLSALINKKSGIDFGEIVDLVPIDRGKSGRIIRLKIVGSKQELIVGKELEIRKWLSESHLYSSAFTVEKVIEEGSNLPNQFILHGSGWGHGVGMCQIGAAVMSQKGFSSTEILEHYFKGAQIETFY
jgi:SpoIID/LytB domain protein